VRPFASIITPTYQRQKLLKMQHANVLRETMQDFEWLILDDSPEPAAFSSNRTIREFVTPITRAD
jgi:hypothetical protein